MKAISLDDVRVEKARRSFKNFVTYMDPAYEWNWHHDFLAKKLDAFANGKIKRLMVFMPPRHGKALDVETPILTKKGFKKLLDVKKGDFVAGPKGWVKVIWSSPIWGNRECFEVTTDDGASVVADASHEWRVRLCRKRKVWRDYETAFLASRASDRNPLIPDYEAPQFDEKSFDVGPYTLGVWLGDGTRHCGMVTKCSSDRAHILKRVLSEGHAVTEQEKTFYIKGFLKFFKSISQPKRIPETYFQGSIAQRLALLQGLIDTDGHVTPDGQIEFSSKDFELAQGVQRLVNSLGVKAFLNENKAMLYGKDCGKRFRVCFYMKGAASLPRKEKLTRNAIRTPGRYISFRKVESRNTKCIEVEGNLFLAGERLIVTHNSQQGSRLLSPYLFGKNPNEEIIFGSYSGDLATRMGLDVQRNIDNPLYNKVFPHVLLPESEFAPKITRGEEKKRTSDFFELLKNKGSFRAAGVGQGINGMGGSVLILDDPIKDSKEASSAVVRQSTWDWYSTTFRSRLLFEGKVLIIMTRWHEDDPAGRLIEMMNKDPLADQWEIVNFPAIKEDNENKDDPREIGEALWPSHFPLNELHKIRAGIPPHYWSSLYQQSPTQAGGNRVKREHFQFYDKLPSNIIKKTITVDCSFKKTEDTDFVSIQVWVNSGPNFYKVWRVKDRMGFSATLKAIATVIAMHPDYSEIIIEEKANGAAIIDVLKSKFYGVIAINPTESKEARLEACSPLIEAGNVFLPSNPACYDWVEDFIKEVTAFPKGKNDDQVDAMTQYLGRFIVGFDDYLQHLMTM